VRIVSQYRYIHSVWPGSSTGDGSTLSLDFTTGVLDSRLNFTRSTTGTYINSSGYVTSAAIDAPRFNYSSTGTLLGLLIESSSVNLVTQSNGSTSVWTIGANRTPTNNTTDLLSPDGTNNATKIVCGTATNYAAYATNITGLTGGGTYTVSYWIRGPVGHTPRLYALNGTVGDVTATSTTGTYNNTGWTRLTQTYTLPATTTQVYVYFASIGIVNTGDTFYVWGFQFEAGSVASSHIPTTTSTGSRAADSCVMTGSNFSSWFNATEGTLLAHAIRSRTSDIGRIASVNDNTANESIQLAADTTGKFIVVDGGSTLATISPGTVTANTAFKIAGAYKLNDVQAALGGTLGTADTAVTMPTVDRLMIGQQAGGSPVYLNGTISLLKYWPTRLTNAELQSITT
jgi:hypothetical protein